MIVPGTCFTCSTDCIVSWGQILADELARRLGKERCWLVTWPGSAHESAAEPSSDAMNDDGALMIADVAATFRKDANHVLTADGSDALRKLVDAAKRYPIN